MDAQRRHTRPVWFPRLTVRGGMFLAVGSTLFLNALIIDRRDLLFVACLLLAVPVAAVAYVAVRVPNVHVTRAFLPPIVPVGGDTVVSLRLRNLSARPLHGARWRDTAAGIVVPASALLPGLDATEGRPAGTPTMGPDTVRLEYTATPRQRGVHDVGPLLLACHDPFGLAFSERPVGTSHDLIVTPRITPLPGSGLSITSGDGSIRELVRHINPSSDELIAREYRPGDPMRRVNWPATARHGEIMVRQEEQRSNPAARIILDTTLGGRAPYSTTAEFGVAATTGPGSLPGGDRGRRHEQAFELAIELAASVGVHLLDGGFRLEVVELGPSQLAPDAEPGQGGLRGDLPSSFGGPGGDRLLLEGLAGVVPVAHGTPDADRARGVPGGAGGVPTFAILVDIDDRDVSALAALRARCDPAVAFVLDTMSRAAVDRLQDAGWHCIALRGPRDIPAAWNQVNRERGSDRD